MPTEQVGDVTLFQTNNDGDILMVDGVMDMTPGLETSVYLSLFGGNYFDTGNDGDINEYWGNAIVDSPDQKLRSETQNTLAGSPATTNNLTALRKSVERDLEWLISSRVAQSYSVTTSLTGVNRLKIVIDITAVNNTEIIYNLNWLASVT